MIIQKMLNSREKPQLFIYNEKFTVADWANRKTGHSNFGFLNGLNASVVTKEPPMNMTINSTCNLCLAEGMDVWPLCLCKAYAICGSCRSIGLPHAYKHLQDNGTCMFGKRHCAFRSCSDDNVQYLKGCDVHVVAQPQIIERLKQELTENQNFNEYIRKLTYAPITYRSDWIIFYINKICVFIIEAFFKLSLLLDIITFIRMVMRWYLKEDYTLTTFYYNFIRFKVTWLFIFPIPSCKFPLVYFEVFKLLKKYFN